MFSLKPVFMQVMALLKENGWINMVIATAEKAEPISAGTAGTLKMMLANRMMNGSKQSGLIL